jgi:hypothetical protein
MSEPRETIEDFLARGGAVASVDPAAATNHDPHFGKRVAQIRRAADPRWKPKKHRRR